ncbi:hypothetical protein POV27_12755 [Aureisphaera galaxeae]|uniref:hypothetical protein n=1 Tax=Aureisphaera galaxeae TaxID=1538023 RepID=UPI002350924C|nr:hypothetical protein [Aureisphaera galaxeae]MDC8004924.1 hypothetical protein [Aureisphaera galaxeae]
MKTAKSLFFVVLLFMGYVQVAAQGYTPPSRDRVEALLERADDCKKNIEKEEENLKMMEADPESVTLAQYNATKQAIAAYKKCLNVVRKELDSLRKDYPGWFNSPSATLEVTVHRQIIIITPLIILAMLTDMEGVMKAIQARFGAIPEPGH